MGFKANDPSILAMIASGQVIDQQTGEVMGGTAPARLSDKKRAAKSDPKDTAAEVSALVTLSVRIDGLVLVSEANVHQHHHQEIRRKKAVRAAIEGVMPRLDRPIPLPAVVTLTRVGTGTKPLDDDNLRRSLKLPRDIVSELLLKADDGDRRIRWRYRQRRGWSPAVVIEVRQRRPS